jgi:hypothetical protein
MPRTFVVGRRSAARILLNAFALAGRADAAREVELASTMLFQRLSTVLTSDWSPVSAATSVAAANK